MICGSTSCKYFYSCVWSQVNAKPGIMQQVEPFDRFGSGSYTYNAETKQVEVYNHYMCENYSMYTNIQDAELFDNAIEEPKQIEEKEMSTRLEICAKIYNYIPSQDRGFTLASGKQVEVSSVDNYDTLVRIKYKDTEIIVSAEELEKAITICTSNR